MTYRDSFEQCPRCHVALVDAQAARGCPTCGGLWLDEATLTEMLHAMLPPRPRGPLVLAVLDRVDAPIGCPSCGAVMDATAIEDVALDRCEQHGIWFDAQELAQALLRVTRAGGTPPFADPAEVDPFIQLGGSLLVLQIDAPDEAPRTLTFEGNVVVKIGRLASCDVRLLDRDVSRLHAILDRSPHGEVLIHDLGSMSGTHVNGARVDRATLRSGDVLMFGASLVTVRFA